MNFFVRVPLSFWLWLIILCLVYSDFCANKITFKGCDDTSLTELKIYFLRGHSIKLRMKVQSCWKSIKIDALYRKLSTCHTRISQLGEFNFLINLILIFCVVFFEHVGQVVVVGDFGGLVATALVLPPEGPGNDLGNVLHALNALKLKSWN